MDIKWLILIAVIGFLTVRAAKRFKRIREDRVLKEYDGNKRVPYPSNKTGKGKRRAPEQIEKNSLEYAKKLAEKGRQHSKVEKIKQSRMGVKKYIWRTSEDCDVCSICAKNNGKTFSWNKPPVSGHPGEGLCCQDGVCRCYAEAKI